MIDWGDVPTWLALAAAVAAGTAAFGSARAARKQLDLLREDREEERKEKRRLQASQFAVWFTNDYQRTRAEIHRSNSSQQPIWDVTIWLHIGDEAPVELVKCDNLSPTVAPTNIRRAADNLPSRTGRSHQELLQLRDDVAIRAAVHFRDAAGLYWYRAPNGVLTESSEITVT